MERTPTGPQLWKTQQVAEALGLSPSTVKRLVDAGQIRAARTAGGHRLIAYEELIRYAREQNLPLAGIRGGREVEAAVVSAEELASSLRRGRAEEARRTILAGHGLGGAVPLGDDLVRPAMQSVGHDWSIGTLDVFQEHRATRIVESALTDLIGGQVVPTSTGRGGHEAPLALGSGPEGDPYTLAGLLCELALREQGWEVMNLGPNLPMASLARAVLAHRPRLVWITVSHLADPDHFVREYGQFYASAARTGAAVILGGQALGPDLRPRLVSAGFGERLAHLVELARTLHPARAGGAGRARDRD